MQKLLVFALAGAAATLGALMFAPSSSAGGTSRMCHGRVATIAGTSGSDRIEGTPGNDVIAGFGGADHIAGFAGDDVICGGGGNDHLRGGPGDDTLVGGHQSDGLKGLTGADVLLGGPGPDGLRGGAGNDVIRGGPGDDSALLDRGHDAIRGGAGFDVVIGLISRRIDVTQPFEIDLSGRTARVGVGRDRVFGVEAVTVRRLGTVLILGNDANNHIDATGRTVGIRGRGGNDVVHGGAHDDQLQGGAGDDEMQGGFGDDTLDGGAGTDTLHGGPGTDTCNDGEACSRIVSVTVRRTHGRSKFSLRSRATGRRLNTGRFGLGLPSGWGLQVGRASRWSPPSGAGAVAKTPSPPSNPTPVFV